MLIPRGSATISRSDREKLSTPGVRGAEPNNALIVHKLDIFPVEVYVFRDINIETRDFPGGAPTAAKQ